MIGAFSGLRPTEMYNLTWGDVLGYRAGRGKPVDQRDIRLQVRGKGKAARRSRRRRRSHGSTPCGCCSSAQWVVNPLTRRSGLCERAGQAGHLGGQRLHRAAEGGWVGTGPPRHQAHAVLAPALLHQRAASQWVRGAGCGSQLPHVARDDRQALRPSAP